VENETSFSGSHTVVVSSSSSLSFAGDLSPQAAFAH